MDRIAPFRAVRYNPRKINKLEKTVAPPYDCISPQEQRALYNRSPYNCVRLILRKGTFGPSADDRFYAAIARDFRNWQSRGVLKRDTVPAYYLYRQDYIQNGRRFSRTGIFALLGTTGYGKQVLPHERTLAGPKKDRLKLLKATHANFSAIFGLYTDPRRVVAKLVRPVQRRRPIASIRGANGIQNRLWIISDPWRVQKISRALQSKRVWIADGHHRFETALAFSRWARKRKLKINSGHTLACLVAMEDPGCRILAIHRLIRISKHAERKQVMADLARRFSCRKISTMSQLVRAVERPGKLHRIGVYDGSRFYLLTAPKRPGRLDTEFLDQKILGPLVRRLHLRRGHELQFEHDPRRVEARIKKREHHFGFLMAPTRLVDMERMTAKGKRMPEKSTYFYPKILTGLVFNQF